MNKVTIIGGGNLGSALALGLNEENGKDIDVVVTGRTETRLAQLQEKGIPTSVDNASSVAGAQAVIICVLPSQVKSVLEEISQSLTADTIVICAATGVSISEIKDSLSAGKVVRAMPNTAASIGMSMTCLTSNDLSEVEMSQVRDLFACIGETIIIEEDLMQAATVLGASGIAFFLRYIRAATQGGIQMGFHPEEAQLIAVQTAIGAASLVKQGKNHPEIEIDMVTTPRGCTIEGLNEMEHQGMSSAVIKGIMTSYNKINSMR